MPRIHHCLGSVQAEAELPDADEAPSDEARQGTEIAAALEQMSAEGLDSDGKNIFDRLIQMENRALGNWLSSIGSPPYRGPMRELRLWITRITQVGGAKLASAQPDVYYIAGEHALVINHKTGYLPVPSAPINFQVRCEAVAIKHAYPQVKRVRAALARYRFTEEFSVTDYSEQDLAYAEQELILTLWRASQPGAARTPGDWCRYCRANGTCQQAAAYSLLPAVMTARVSAKMGVPITEEYCVAMVSNLTPEQMAFVHQSAPIIAKITEAVKERLKGLPPETLQGLGLKLSAPGAIRQLPDVITTWEAMWAINQMFGDPPLIELVDFQQTCKVGLGRLEELLTQKIAQRTGTTLKAAKARAAKLLEPTVRFEPTSPKLLTL